jgi:hypothetical protein
VIRRGGVSGLERNDGAVLPEALETVIDPLLLVEDVDDQVAEVQQHPSSLRAALAAHALVARLDELVFDLIGDRGDVALAVPGDEQEDVDERKRLRHVQGDEVFTALRDGCVGCELQHLYGGFR